MKFERPPQLRVPVPLGLLVAAWCFALDATATETVGIPQVVPIAEDVDVSPARMAITEVTAFGGGAWSGAKWMTVKGTLVENDKPIASFRAKRYSTGGAFGGFKGTCSIIGRCTKAIAQIIAEWLKNPVDGARLGDAQ